MKNFVNFGSPPIHLAPLRRVDREADKRAYLSSRRLSRAVREWIEEDYGPEVKGRYGEPCPSCSQFDVFRRCGQPINVSAGATRD